MLLLRTYVINLIDNQAQPFVHIFTPHPLVAEADVWETQVGRVDGQVFAGCFAVQALGFPEAYMVTPQR